MSDFFMVLGEEARMKYCIEVKKTKMIGGDMVRRPEIIQHRSMETSTIGG
jgi:hypothetical protein